MAENVLYNCFGEEYVAANSFYSFAGFTTNQNNESRRQIMANDGIQLDTFCIWISENSSEDDVIFTLRVNGVDTALVITVPAGKTGFFEGPKKNLYLESGDLFCFRAGPGTQYLKLKCSSLKQG